MTSRHLTLFDLDGTLIAGDSDHSFGEFMVAIGWADGDTWRRRNDAFYATYVAGALDVHAYVAFATSVWRGRTPQEQADVRARYMREIIVPMLTPRAMALVKKHQDEGDLVAIVTATNEFVTRPNAWAIGVPEQHQRDVVGQLPGGARAARDRARARWQRRRHRRHQGRADVPARQGHAGRAVARRAAGRLGRFRSHQRLQ
jgi:phosphoserine phosphatase